jgi:hypothetical protein
MRGMKRVALLLALCAGAAACGKVQAKTPAPPPALTVPEPPTRVVMPVNVDPPATEKPVPATTTRPTAGRPAATPVASPTPTPAPPTTEATPPVLQTSANLADLENKARERVEKAQKDLGRITRKSLGKDAQDQFDSAERFLRMATDAMKMKNFVYASFCAEKASTLAELLIK